MITPYYRYLLLIVLTIFMLPAQAEITSLGSAINKAGRQRMLSQRILKAYALLGSRVDTLKAQSELDSSITLFERQLKELEAYSPNNEIKQSLAEVAQLWTPYKNSVHQPARKDRAMSLLSDSDRLLSACHKVVLLLEKKSESPSGHWVNIAGRQRMLSQRLSKLYIYQAWGFNTPLIREQMNQSRDEFITALREMTSAPINSSAINRRLKQARSEWKLFKHGLDGVEKHPIPYIVNLAGLKLLKSMNEITRLYELLENK